MSRKQNSLMRFTRTERLAQLSEQETVIEQKKKEIQAKIEARRKNQSEEVFKRLEAYKEIKTNQTEISYNSLKSRDYHEENKKSEDATQELNKDGLKNAFSNDGSFLDQFKKLSQSGLVPNSAKLNTSCASTKLEESLKDSQSIKKPLNSNIQIQLPPPGIVQFFPNQSFQSWNVAPEIKKGENLHQSELQACSSQYQEIPSAQLNSHENPLMSSQGNEKLVKAHTDAISMTFKSNSAKKLELISNPLHDDDDDDYDDDEDVNDNDNDKNHGNNDSSKKNLSGKYIRYPKSLSAEKATCSSQYQTTQVQKEDSLRISPASCGDKEREKITDGKRNLGHLAKMVANLGDDYEDILRRQKENDPEFRFLFDKESEEYITFRNFIVACRQQSKNIGSSWKEKKPHKSSSEGDDSDSEKCQNLTQSQEKKRGQSETDLSKMCDQTLFTITKQSSKNRKLNIYDGYQADSEGEITNYKIPEKNSLDNTANKCSEKPSTSETASKLQSEERRKRKRKSRWDDAVSFAGNIEPPTLATNLNLQTLGNVPTPKTNLLSQLTRSDPGLLQYAKQTFGSTNLSEEDWKKAEDHYKINLLYQDLVKKRAEISKLERAGKFKYEYDSDEDVEGGTWEHKLRQQEMMATQLWAEELTRQAAGKHHIGDFLPPEELEKFMERYNAVKEGREPDLSDYKEFKLKEDNVGYKLLQKMGWNEGQGLGQDGSGITNPVNKPSTRHENQGLGIERPDGLEPGDDEYDAYRKRMMLAYRFRPNPLNNPRRPYY